MTSQRVGIYLPRVYPPKVPVTLPGGIVHQVTDDEIRSQFGDTLGGESLTGMELSLLRKRTKRGDDWVWVVYERNARGPTDESFLALLDLLSGDWTHRVRVPVALTYGAAATMRRAVRMRHLTAGLAAKLRAGIQFVLSNRRAEVALHRWGASYKRSNALESVLDCCAALEAVVRTENELRLRLALSVGDLVPRRKAHSRRLVYRLYGVRNKFVHGAAVPSVSTQDGEALIGVTAAVLREVIRANRLPAPHDETRLLAM